MMFSQSYKNAFFIAIAFHIMIAILLLVESNNSHPVLKPSNQTEMSMAAPSPASNTPTDQAIKAVSVDSKEVMQTVNRLKEEKAKQEKAEISRQQMLNKQVEAAKQQRLAEQQRLEKLKIESNKLAIAHKKQMEDEQKHIKELAIQKAEEEKRISLLKKQKLEMEKQQKIEADLLAEAKLKKEAIAANASALKAKQEKEELEQKQLAQKLLLKKQSEQKQLAAANESAMNAAKNAEIAGEVDKYKALIIQAISSKWILPENANSSMSSQFRIRLAPNGLVLEVNLIRSSGDPILDRSAQSAIYKASPLPVPSDPNAFNVFRDISLTVRPENYRG